MKHLWIILALAGCVGAGAYAGTAIKAAQDAKDLELQILLAAVCAISVGALGRKGTSEQIDAVVKLCANKGINADDLKNDVTAVKPQTDLE